jgi:hypothetical protein
MCAWQCPKPRRGAGGAECMAPCATRSWLDGAFCVHTGYSTVARVHVHVKLPSRPGARVCPGSPRCLFTGTGAHMGTRITQTSFTTIQTHQHTRTSARRPNPRPTQQPQPRSRPLPAADSEEAAPCEPDPAASRPPVVLRYMYRTFLERTGGTDCLFRLSGYR